MHRRITPVILLFGAFALSACADEVLTDPTTGTAAAAPSDNARGKKHQEPATPQVEDLPRHLVLFDSDAPRRFAAHVLEMGGRVMFVSDAIGAAGVEGLTDEQAASLTTIRGVALVEAEPVLPLAEPVAVSAPVAVDAVPASPSDPTAAFFYPRQWNMRAIGADRAWAAGRTGSSDVTVAILDTGIGYTHEDLVGRVDLSRSVSFVSIDDAYVDFYFPGAHPIADIGYHGTHVASTVASNGIIAAGVTSEVTLMGVKVCSVVTGGCPGAAVIGGMLHAIENGADVVNMSLGGWFDRSAFPGYVSVLNSIANYAKQNNVTFVVSAGNESIDLDKSDAVPIEDEEGNIAYYISVPSLYKTYCDNVHVLCISATGPTDSEGTNGPWANVDAPAYYTNYGHSAIDVAGPGGSSGGLVWAACSTFSLVFTVCQDGGFALSAAGTSMAAPHVSGLAALAVEDVGKNVAAVRDYVRNSADDFGDGHTAFYGTGRIDVARAVGAN